MDLSSVNGFGVECKGEDDRETFGVVIVLIELISILWFRVIGIVFDDDVVISLICSCEDNESTFEGISSENVDDTLVCWTRHACGR